MSNENNDSAKVLKLAGVDLTDVSRAVHSYRAVTAQRGDKESAAFKELEAAWGHFIETSQSNFNTAVESVVGQLNSGSLNARGKAEALEKFAHLGEKHTTALPLQFALPHPEQVLPMVLELLLSSPSLTLRCICLRVVESFAADVQFLKEFYRLGGHLMLCKSLDNYTDHQEHKHASAVLHQIVEVCRRAHAEGKEAPELPVCICCRVASVLDFSGDPTCRSTTSERRAATRTLLDALDFSPATVAAAGGVRLLLTYCLNTSSVDTVRSIIRSVLSLYASPSTRMYLQSEDIGVLFAPFLEYAVQDPATHLEVMKKAKAALCCLLQSWTGLFWLATEFSGLHSLVDVLHLPGPAVRKMVLLHLFNTLIRNAAPHRGIPDVGPWTGVAALESAERVREYNPNPTSDAAGSPTSDGFEDIKPEDVPTSSNFFSSSPQRDDGTLRDNEEDIGLPTTKSAGYHILDPFAGALLLVLDIIGLPKALMTVIKLTSGISTNATLPQGAAQLLQQVLVLMDTVIPRDSVKSLHKSFDALIAKLSSQSDGFIGSMTTKLFQDVAYHSHQQFAVAFAHAGAMSQQPSLPMEDSAFQRYLRETHVEGDYARWNFETLMMLLQGPLRNPSKLRWTRDKTQFFPRILFFYKPGRGGYAAMHAKDESEDRVTTPIVAHVGAALVEMLLASKEGVEMLERSELVKDLNSLIVEVAEKKAAQTLPIMYSFFLSSLTRCRNGIELLRKNGLFTTLQGIFKQEIAAMDPLTAVLHDLLQRIYFGAVPNHGVCHEARMTLQLALQSTSNPVRLCAMRQLRKAMWRDLTLNMEWGVDRLLERLDDSFDSVIDGCFSILSSVCAVSEEALDYLIKKNPTGLLRAAARASRAPKTATSMLLLRILGRTEGFAFLKAEGWVDEQLLLLERSYLAYPTELENDVEQRSMDGAKEGRTRVSSVVHVRSLSDPATRRGRAQPTPRSTIDAEDAANDVMPLHFLGELCRTDVGCAYFCATPLFAVLMRAIAEGTSAGTNANAAVNATIQAQAAAEDSPRMSLHLSQTTFESLISEKVPLNLSEIADESSDLPAAKVRATKQATESQPSDNDVLLSACLGYDKAPHAGNEVDCLFPLNEVRAAVLAIGHIGTSDIGFSMLRQEYLNVLGRFTLLAQFASSTTLRGDALIAISLFARSNCGSQYLSQHGFSVTSVQHAYVSHEGVPYSVAFAVPPSTQWATTRFPPRCSSTTPTAVYNEARTLCTDAAGANVPPKIIPASVLESLGSLTNAFTNLAAARRELLVDEYAPLYRVPEVQQYIVWLTGVFRMRREARQIIVDCLLQRNLQEAPLPIPT